MIALLIHLTRLSLFGVRITIDILLRSKMVTFAMQSGSVAQKSTLDFIRIRLFRRREGCESVPEDPTTGLSSFAKVLRLSMACMVAGAVRARAPGLMAGTYRLYSRKSAPKMRTDL